MNKLLIRQLNKNAFSRDKLPDDSKRWNAFLDSISNYYLQVEEDRYLLERSLEISSREMKERMEKNKKIGLRLAQASKLASVGTLASGVAHELNNPLQIIRGMAEIISATASDEGSKEKAAKIISLVERMGNITKQLLKLARTENENDIGKIAMSQPIEETLDLMKRQLKYDDISLSIDSNDPDLFINASNSQLCGVFQNLLANSHQAFEEHRDKVPNKKIEIKIYSDSKNKRAVVEIKDNAGGIPKKILNRIFDPFFTTKPVNKGTGLGLSLSRQTVEKFGGTIKASVKGQCTTFLLSFPQYCPTKNHNRRATFANIEPEKFPKLKAG